MCDLSMCENVALVKIHCEACGLDFWVKPGDDPRFCPFCERSVLIEKDLN